MTDRPAPERFLDLIRDQQRGRLKIYLGFAPGVGKTYEMLQEAQRLKRQGVDVVIGIVETHGRPDTVALVGELEQVPRRQIEYRGVVLEEMDLDAVLTRHPTVAVVDELAHTNAPGSRHAKRYEDVAALLRAGIHVLAAMNIQHLESLYDAVQRFTGVAVKERVPDHVLAEADQIVNVDVPAEDLQERMRAGKIYPAERVERALTHFFTGDNLSRLRELALDEVARALDRRRRGREPGAVAGSERLMVCISSGSPDAAALLRKAARLADRLGAPWYAVYIRTPRERVERVDAATDRRIHDGLELARKLGGIALEFRGPDLPTAAALFVAEYAITHIVLGRSRRSWLRRLWGGSLFEQLLSRIRAVDVTVIDAVSTLSGIKM